MRKTITYEVRPAFACTCGARYDTKPDKCEIVVGSDHTIRELKNRDTGKVYAITEMSAVSFARWCVKLFTALANSGMRLPEGLETAGIAGVVALGAGGLGSLLSNITSLDADSVQSLIDELLVCVKIRPDPRHPEVERALAEEDIAEVSTYFKLVGEVFKLHVNFS